MKFDDIPAMLKKVERAIENLSASIEKKEGSEADRVHKRFQQSHMMARFHFVDHESFTEEMLYQAPLKDVSAGGMGLVLPTQLNVNEDDKIQFKVYKQSSLKSIIEGLGYVVRIEDEEGKRVLGIKFDEVNH